MTFEEWWEQIEAYGIGLPEGYVIVPVEPTDKMINEFWNVVQVGSEARPSDIYKAMIQAAQEVD